MLEEPTKMQATIGCDKCKGTGFYLYTDENGYEFARECDCGLLKRDKQARMLEFANIPKAFEDYRLKNFRVDVYRDKDSKANISNVVKAIKYWLENLETMLERGKGLFIFSNTKGSGKTRIAVSVANELMEKHNIFVKFATSMQVINEIKASWDREKETSESRLLEQLISAEVLVIDDFGVEEVKGWIAERFYHIINGRYINKKVTIFTSNVSVDALEYDDRIINRIKEMCYLIPFPEESVREHIAETNKEELLKGVKGDRKAEI